MKQNIGTKLSIGLLVAIVAYGAATVVLRSKAAKAEMQKAQAAAAAAEAAARPAESRAPVE